MWKREKMQRFGDITLTEAYETFWKNTWRSLRKKHIFQLMNAKDSEDIMASARKHLHYFSKLIVKVEETKMALLKEGLVPRKLNQWLKKATNLKCQLSDALKKQQNSKDPSLIYTDQLKEMCHKIYHHMLDLPIKVVNDKPLAFIAQMHETEDGKNLSDTILLPSEDGLPAQDVEKEVVSTDKEGKIPITIRTQSDIVSFLKSSYGLPRIKSKPALTLDNMLGGETVEAKSSHIHYVATPEISPHEDLSSSYIPELKDEKDLRIIEEGERSSTSLGKIHIGTSENNPPHLRVEPSSLSSPESKHHTESELSMMVQILIIGELSKYMDLRLQILSMSPTQGTFNLNHDFGLHPRMDSYMFSAMKKPAELEPDSQRTLMANSTTLLPRYMIVKRSGLKEMLTDQEWRLAGVVNLIEKKVCVLNEEPHCPNLVILFLQRNSRLTDICSSFFNQMPALRFLDLSDTRIKALPSSLFELKNLQVLLLRNCVCLDSLPPKIKNLINMEALDLLGTELSHLPEEISELTKLRHLQLSFHQPDSQSKLVQSGAIFKLHDLQGLSIVVHPEDQHWKSIVGEIIKHVAKPKMLRYLQFYFPTVEALKSFSEVNLSWREHRLRSFKFLVGHNIKRIISRVPGEVESKYEQYDRCLRFVNGNGNEVPEIMKSILERVTAFYLDHHLDVASLSDFDISIFKELKFCVLRECPNIHIMIKREERTESAFPNLEYLGLHYLWKLEQIWEDQIPSGSYHALKYLMVSTCGKLEFIASHAVLRGLSNLETFIIEDCESLKSIVKETELVKYDEPLLPRLKQLVLRHLPQLVALGRGLFPFKAIISIHFCPEFVHIPGPNKIEWKKFLHLS